MDAITLRNRLLVAATMWRETSGEPLPKMPAGEPEEQLQAFELTLVDMICRSATPQSAAEAADRTWDLVHDRPDGDPVKQRVVERHEELARLRRDGP
jgi:hypothetical protein